MLPRELEPRGCYCGWLLLPDRSIHNATMTHTHPTRLQRMANVASDS